ncbi:MAG: alpha/beta hydrolase [Burkholderiales bacterium]
MQLAVSNSGSLYYEVIDLTPPWLKEPDSIVFSHGVGTNSYIWHAWKPILAPFFRLVFLDTRGFGRSSRHGVDFRYSFDLWANDIVEIADAAGAEKFHLVGESMAGAVALHLSGTQHGRRLLSLTTCSSPYRGADLPRVGDWKERLKRNDIAAWSATMMDQRFYADALAEAEFAWFAAEQLKSDASTLLGWGECLLQADLTETLKKISVPSLLLAPDNSPYVTVDIANAMRKLIPGADLMVFPDARHGLPFSHGEECAVALLDFLDRKGFVAE